MIKRYTEIDQPNAVYEWGMKEDPDGGWVKYEDIKHLLERSDNSNYAKCPDCGEKLTIVKQSLCTNRDCVSYALQ